MLLGKYTFNSTFLSETILPEYKGSTLRGALGHALKRVVCNIPEMTCEQCLLAPQCAYVALFEPDLSGKSLPDLNLMSAMASPFVIEPPLTTKTQFSAGDSLAFNLILFGETNDLLPYLIYAFENMGQMGLGKKVGGHRGQFQLNEIINRGKVIYSPEKQCIQAPDPLECLDIHPISDPRSISSIKIILETPLRFKMKGKVCKTLHFEHLMRVVLRRVSFLMACYGEKPLTLDFDHLIQQSKAVQMHDNQCRWFDWQRYSARQDCRMNLGGISGSVVYSGDLDIFLPFLLFCEKVHIGKQTSFGLGQFRLEYLTDLAFSG
jgi:hypothetical protein